MKDVSKKRRASVSDGSDADTTSHKKSKTSSAPAGKDDEGNPYWDVSLSPFPSCAAIY